MIPASYRRRLGLWCNRIPEESRRPAQRKIWKVTTSKKYFVYDVRTCAVCGGCVFVKEKESENACGKCAVCTRNKERVVVMDLQTKEPWGTWSTHRHPCIRRVVKSLQTHRHTQTFIHYSHNHFEVIATTRLHVHDSWWVWQRHNASAYLFFLYYLFRILHLHNNLWIVFIYCCANMLY